MSQSTTDDEEQTPEDLFRTAVVVESGMGVFALVLGYALGPSARDLIPPATEAFVATLMGGLGLGVVATIPLLVFVALVRRVDHPAVKELDRLGDHPMIGLMLRLSDLELFVISLCAGVGEELLFRGWLLPWLAGALAGEPLQLVTTNPDVDPAWWAFGGWLGGAVNGSGLTFSEWWSQSGGWTLAVAWLVSSIAFGFAHNITKLYVAITALMGLYFGFLLILTGNLLIPIVAHALYDAIQLWMAAREKVNERN